MKNKILIGILSLICFGHIQCSRAQIKTGDQPFTFDPVEFGKEFPAVCKVGMDGGDGTLIETRWVLTAGHVADGMFLRSNGNLMVYFENGSEYQVKNVYLHPKFEPMGLFDVALLELSDDVKGIMPMKIFSDTTELNKEIVLVGHGDKRKPDGSWIKDGKLRAYTNVIDKVTLTHILFDYDGPDNNPTKCEGSSGPGDSGGPALIKVNNEYHVAGISSMGEPGENGPATFGAVEHFVRVSAFRDWIKSTMANPSNPLVINESIKQSNNQGWSSSIEAGYAQIIVEALRNFTETKMRDAISNTYDPTILKKRSPEEIMNNMPHLISELKNAHLKSIIAETEHKISLSLLNNSSEYILDIYFSPLSKKIEQMGFANINKIQ